jgi:hypothetical protein
LPAESKPPRKRIEITLSGSNFAHNAAVPPPALSNLVATVTPEPSPAPPVVTNTPAPAAVQPVNTNVAPVEPAAPPPPAASAPPPPDVAVKVQPPTPVASPGFPAAAVAPASTGQQVATFVTAFSLLTIAVVLVLFLMRRSKGGAAPSLISQSIDRSR